MLGIRKTLQIGSHLCHQHIQDVPTYPIDLFSARDLFFKRVQVRLDLLFQVSDRTILNRNQREQLS
jgi:hypothetical protein